MSISELAVSRARNFTPSARSVRASPFVVGGPLFTAGEHSLLISLVLYEKRPDILLKEKFLFFAINENSCWIYALAVETISSSHFRPAPLPLHRLRQFDD